MMVTTVNGTGPFTVTVPAGGAITIDTNTGVVTDSGMAVYSGAACTGLTLIECDDDASDNGLMSSISLAGKSIKSVPFS